MNRKLIFITNDGGMANYLPGIKLDMQHYRNFFSDEGGAWMRLYAFAVIEIICAFIYQH